MNDVRCVAKMIQEMGWRRDSLSSFRAKRERNPIGYWQQKWGTEMFQTPLFLARG